MKFKNKIYIYIILVGIFIISVGVTGLLYNYNLSNELNNIKSIMKSNSFSDNDLKYLLEKKYITKNDFNKIKESFLFVKKSNVLNQDTINKLKKNNIEITKTYDKVIKKIKKNIIDQQSKQQTILKSISTYSNSQYVNKKLYLEKTKDKIESDRITYLINFETKINENNENITSLQNEVHKSMIINRFKDIPDIITKEEIAKFGVYYPEFNDQNNQYLFHKKYTPKLCELKEARPQTILTNIKENSYLIDKVIYEHHHINNYYLTMFNSKFDGITTLTDTNENKNYLVYESSISSNNCNIKQPGSAALIILYDFIDKKIVSITSTQNYSFFIIKNTYISFIIDNGKIIYIEDIQFD